jgi:hypothetical protein
MRGITARTVSSAFSAHLGDCAECCRRIDQTAASDPLLARLHQSAAEG